MYITIGTSRNKTHIVIEEVEAKGSYPIKKFACGGTAKTGGFSTLPVSWVVELSDVFGYRWCEACRKKFESMACQEK